jgi:peptide deformylase
MAILDLKYYGASVLTRPAKPVKHIDRELLTLAQDMLDSMYHYNGVGLAAPQVGVSKRFFIVDCGEEYQKEPFFLVNPEVISVDGKQMGGEGCLSLPEFYTEVERPESCVIKAMDLSGKEITVKGKGLLARALLHELDHLNGILFTEHVDNEEALNEGIPVLKNRIKKILNGELNPQLPLEPEELAALEAELKAHEEAQQQAEKETANV